MYYLCSGPGGRKTTRGKRNDSFPPSGTAGPLIRKEGPLFSKFWLSFSSTNLLPTLLLPQTPLGAEAIRRKKRKTKQGFMPTLWAVGAPFPIPRAKLSGLVPSYGLQAALSPGWEHTTGFVVLWILLSFLDPLQPLTFRSLHISALCILSNFFSCT